MKRFPLFLLTLAAVLWLAAQTIGPIPAGEVEAEETSPDVDASPPAGTVTVDDCAGCHDAQIESFRRGPHGVLERDAALAGHYGAVGCEGCHGDPAAHLDSGGEPGTLLAFSDDDLPGIKTAACQSCHGDAHPRFAATRHAAAGLDCTSCHSAHSSGGDPSLLKPVTGADLLGLRGAVSASCGECHRDVLAQFEFNERHRLQEGILDCASCHSPHEPSTRLALGGFKQEACVDCHADKGGPFVFEHGAQRVEGCVACHQPHGGPDRHMLTFQSVAELCYTCHAAVPGFHTRFTADTVCTNCHSTIHGSNFDPAFLK